LGRLSPKNIFSQKNISFELKVHFVRVCVWLDTRTSRKKEKKAIHSSGKYCKLQQVSGTKHQTTILMYHFGGFNTLRPKKSLFTQLISANCLQHTACKSSIYSPLKKLWELYGCWHPISRNEMCFEFHPPL